MLSSPRNPESTIRICSSAENWRRVARRISLTTCFAGSFTGPDFCPIFAPSMATMGQKSSLPQLSKSVSEALMPDNTQYAYRYGERRKSGRNRLSLTYSPLWGGGKANCLAGAGRHEWPRRLFRRGTWSMGVRWSSRDGLYRGDPEERRGLLPGGRPRRPTSW